MTSFAKNPQNKARAKRNAYKKVDFLVELYLYFKDIDDPIIFVDTPGLNGVAEIHMERTIDIVQSVHACIYMLQSRGITDTDKKSLQWIRFKLGLIKKVIFAIIYLPVKFTLYL